MCHPPSQFECFHVTRNLPYGPSSSLAAGTTISVGEIHNPFFGFYENAQSYPVTLQSGEVVQVPAIRFLRAVHAGEVNPHNLPKTALDVSTHYMMLARELLFEEVRGRTDATLRLPSRQTCLWASESLEEAYTWANKFEGPSRILRLQVTGACHRADSKLLLDDSEPLSQTYSKAEAYWRGEGSPDPHWELLVSGTVVVVEEIASS